MARLSFKAGLFIRREIRRAFQSRGISYVEDKGWLESQFVVTDPSRQRIMGIIEALKLSFGEETEE